MPKAFIIKLRILICINCRCANMVLPRQSAQSALVWTGRVKRWYFQFCLSTTMWRPVLQVNNQLFICQDRILLTKTPLCSAARSICYHVPRTKIVDDTIVKSKGLCYPPSYPPSKCLQCLSELKTYLLFPSFTFCATSPCWSFFFTLQLFMCLRTSKCMCLASTTSHITHIGMASTRWSFYILSSSI